MRLATLLLAVVVVLVAAPACTDFDPGMEAYERGDYATALKELRPLAEQGIATAQYNLGVMYETSEGVPQDYAEAVRWYRLAAAQGYADAQYNLGVMYAKGQGGPRDYVQAHMWLTLAAAAAEGEETPREPRVKHMVEHMAEHLTPAQLADAHRLAREWKLKQCQ